jgi:hypothetical protein
MLGSLDYGPLSSRRQGRKMQIGDLVRLKKGLNYSADNRDILGIIIDKHQITSASTRDHGIKEEYLATEYQVNIITNNKTAWYIDDSLELVNESW